MIDLCYSNGTIMVWNAEDVYLLRTEHRIVGNLIGCLPTLPRQDELLGLPLTLMEEEVLFLISRKVARVVEFLELEEPPGINVKSERELLIRSSFEEQAVLHKEERVKQLLDMAEKIIEGKKRKFTGDHFDEQKAIQEELNKITNLSEDHMMIQIFTRPNWNCSKIVERDYATLQPTTNHQSIRSAVFKDLWEKGYYLTGGTKFGCDFLAYPGDPYKFHSHFVVVCVEEHQPLTPHFLISKGRLGTNVKKTVLLCSLNSHGVINYQSLNWNGK